MNEREIRERIERFLKKTARTVVLPASVGLGISLAGCESQALHGKAADAGGDVAAQTADVATSTGQPDLASQPDLIQVALPYLVYIPPDAGPPDVAGTPDLPYTAIPYVVYLPPPDAGPEIAPPVDSGAEAAPPDAGPEVPLSFPPPPYLLYDVPTSPKKLG